METVVSLAVPSLDKQKMVSNLIILPANAAHLRRPDRDGQMDDENQNANDYVNSKLIVILPSKSLDLINNLHWEIVWLRRKRHPRQKFHTVERIFFLFQRGLSHMFDMQTHFDTHLLL